MGLLCYPCRHTYLVLTRFVLAVVVRVDRDLNDNLVTTIPRGAFAGIKNLYTLYAKRTTPAGALRVDESVVQGGVLGR